MAICGSVVVLVRLDEDIVPHRQAGRFSHLSVKQPQPLRAIARWQIQKNVVVYIFLEDTVRTSPKYGGQLLWWPLQN